MRTLALLLLCSTLAAQEYVGSNACAGCHKQIYDHWKRSAMGRSMSPASEHLAKAPATIQNDKFRRQFSVFVEDGQLKQSESGEGFRSAHTMLWAIGSGVNGFSFVLQRGDHLFQAPLSYYSRPSKWDLSPGYEFADVGFNRPIAAACISCHSGRPQPVPQRNGLYKSPPFKELAIGCENCHGPGSNHVSKRGPIVNPAKLPAERAEEVCMFCHQGGDARVLQAGKTEQDFRPGQVLNDVVAIFKLPVGRDTDLLEHHESMHLSRCFRESKQKMTCLTCHNPHAERIDYRAKCLGCHAQSLGAEHPKRASDCIGCHMPKRDVQVIAHSALTNHRIVRTPNQPLPETAFSPNDLVHVNRASNAPLPRLTLLQAYGQLADREPRYYERFQALLDECAKSDADNPLVLASLGRRALRATALDDAIAFLKRSLERGSVGSTTYEDLGEALARAGRLEESAGVLQRGIELAPYTQVLYKSLALRYIKLQRFDDAKNTLKRYVELFPEDDFVRKLLSQVSGTR